MTEMGGAGGGSTAGTQVAAQIGGSSLGSAEHLGTSPGSLDTSSGLLEFTGRPSRKQLAIDSDS